MDVNVAKHSTTVTKASRIVRIPTVVVPLN